MSIDMTISGFVFQFTLTYFTCKINTANCIFGLDWVGQPDFRKLLDYMGFFVLGGRCGRGAHCLFKFEFYIHVYG